MALHCGTSDSYGQTFWSIQNDLVQVVHVDIDRIDGAGRQSHLHKTVILALSVDGMVKNNEIIW
jgi:hypothetical protein